MFTRASAATAKAAAVGQTGLRRTDHERGTSITSKALLLAEGRSCVLRTSISRGLPDLSRYNEAYRPGGYPMGYRFLPLSKGTTLLTQHFRLDSPGLQGGALCTAAAAEVMPKASPSSDRHTDHGQQRGTSATQEGLSLWPKAILVSYGHLGIRWLARTV